MGWKLDRISIAREWFEYASRDISAAEFLMRMTPVPIEIICYHCQQSAEKSLKAFLAYNSEVIPRVHDLTFLLEKCAAIDKSLKDLHDEALDLSDYSVVVRYPFAIDLNIEDARKAIKDAQKIKSTIGEKIHV